MGPGRVEAAAMGARHGDDAARWAQAYGSSETPREEGERRGAEKFPRDPELAGAYASGFLSGYEATEEELSVDDGDDPA